MALHPHPASEIFQQLPGRWSITRDIPGTGRFTGHAVFTPTTPQFLFYEETGKTHLLNGQTIEGFRQFEYRLDETGISIFFRDTGRRDALYVTLPFHDGVHAVSTHACNADLYHHAMTWHGPDNHETLVRICGPKKDFQIHSALGRLSG